MRVGGDWVVRFDGADDHLRRTGLNRSLDACTVFVVAAPHANPGGYRGFLAANEAGRRDYETGFNLDLGPGATALSSWTASARRGPPKGELLGGAGGLRTNTCEHFDLYIPRGPGGGICGPAGRRRARGLPRADDFRGRFLGMCGWGHFGVQPAPRGFCGQRGKG